MPLLRVTSSSVWQSRPQQVPSDTSLSQARSFRTGTSHTLADCTRQRAQPRPSPFLGGRKSVPSTARANTTASIGVSGYPRSASCLRRRAIALSHSRRLYAPAGAAPITVSRWSKICPIDRPPKPPRPPRPWTAAPPAAPALSRARAHRPNAAVTRPWALASHEPAGRWPGLVDPSMIAQTTAGPQALPPGGPGCILVDFSNLKPTETVPVTKGHWHTLQAHLTHTPGWRPRGDHDVPANVQRSPI
jgi:hypothetical protein